jgi:hypothetical protein
VLSSLPCHQNSPLAKCGSKKHEMDGDHTSTCTAHSGAIKAHDWMVSALGPLFRTAGHTVRTLFGVTTSAGKRRADVEICNYLRDQAGSQSLVCDLSISHDRYGSSSHPLQNGRLTHPHDFDAPLRVAAQRKINSQRQQYADNQNISFSLPSQAYPPACTASFCVFFFCRPTGRPRRTSLPLECHRNATNRTRFVSSAWHSTSR